MASDDLICGTSGIVRNIDEYPACPQADFSPVFDAWGQPALTSTGITTEFEGNELAKAQLDSYVLHSLADDERVCYREAFGGGRREWFIQSGVHGFVSSAARLPFADSADKDEMPTAEAAGEGEKPEAKDLSFLEGALLSAAGIFVLYTICKSIIDAAEEGQKLEVLKPEDVGEQNAEKDRAPFVAVPSHEAVVGELDSMPWKAEQWFDGLSDLGRFEVNEILRESIPHMLGDPVFKADFVRDGRITVEGVRAILAERGVNYTSVGSVTVTRAMETRAAETGAVGSAARPKGAKSQKKGEVISLDVARKMGR
jgi:hypothetical protein